MFIGEYHYNLDEKSRVALPAKFRDMFLSGAVITRGLDNSLFVYTQKEWAILAEKLAQLPISQSNSRAFARLMLAGAMDVNLDKQGRVILPEYLRNYAGIQKGIVITGLYNRLEIWDEKTWNDYNQKNEKQSNDIAENLSQIGI